MARFDRRGRHFAGTERAQRLLELGRGLFRAELAEIAALLARRAGGMAFRQFAEPVRRAPELDQHLFGQGARSEWAFG